MATVIWQGDDTSTPNKWDVDANWDTGTKPANNDTVYIVGGQGPSAADIDITDGLSEGSLDLVAVRIDQSFTGNIGLRQTPLSLGAPAGGTTVDIGLDDGNGTSRGSGRINLSLDADNTTDVNVWDSAANPADPGLMPIRLKGGKSTNTVNIRKGNVGLAATLPSDTATLATLNIGYRSNVLGDAKVVCGAGVTVTTINKAGGSLLHQSAATTVNNQQGTYTKRKSGNVTTLNIDGGSALLDSDGTFGTINQRGGTVEWNKGNITAMTVFSGRLATMGSRVARTVGTLTILPGVIVEYNKDAITPTTIGFSQRIKITTSRIGSA